MHITWSHVPRDKYKHFSVISIVDLLRQRALGDTGMISISHFHKEMKRSATPKRHLKQNYKGTHVPVL